MEDTDDTDDTGPGPVAGWRTPMNAALLAVVLLAVAGHQALWSP